MNKKVGGYISPVVSAEPSMKFEIAPSRSKMTLASTLQNKSYAQFSKRHMRYPVEPNYAHESVNVSGPSFKYITNDNPDLPVREPSYTKFKIPYQMKCGERYRKSIYAYEAQLNYEIRQNIEFQSSPAEACFFLRCMAITSLWPPLHNMTEVKHTCKQFFSLTEEERWRLQRIMDTNFT